MSYVQKVSENLSRKEEDFLLHALSAKEGEITTRADLKNYAFECQYCKHLHFATEAVLLKTPLEIEQEMKKGNITVGISFKIALLCKDCAEKLLGNPEGGA